MSSSTTDPTSNDPNTTITYTPGGEKLVSTKTADSDQLAKLYEAYEELEKLGNEASSNGKDAFKTILNGTKQTVSVKTLAANFIPKYFKYFDDMQTEALDAFLDLVEEETPQIRTAAIRGISQICKDKPQYVQQMANVLGQLLPDEEIESVVTESFLSLLETDTKAAVEALCQHATNEDDKELRSKVLAFLRHKVVYGSRKKNVLENSEIEDLIISNLKPLLSSESLQGDDFNHVLYILKRLPKYNNADSAKELLQALQKHSGIDLQNFDATDAAAVQKLIDMTSTVVQLTRAGADAGAVFGVWVQKVLPNYETYEPELTLHVLQCIADISGLVDLDTAKNALQPLYDVLLALVPLPEEGEEPEYNFSFLEPLLYAFHNCGQKAPGALNPVCGIHVFTGQPDADSGDYSEKRDDLKKRMAHFNRSVSDFRRKYKGHIIEDPGVQASEEDKENFILEKKQAAMRNRLLMNLDYLSRPFKEKEPRTITAYNAVDVSWRRPKQNKRKRKNQGPQGGRGSKQHRGNSGARGGRGGRQRGRRGGRR